MSKFFVTNNSDWYNKLKDNVNDSPFKINGGFNNIEGVYGFATRKLQVDNENIYIEGNDVIIQTGTCVYQEEHGMAALKKALRDFDGDVQNHRENYIGNFGCFIRKSGASVVFNEAAGYYDLFYYSSESGWMIGTDLIDMARVLNKYISINKLNILEELIRYAIFNNETYFNNIYRLSGDQYLFLTSDTLTIMPLDLKISQDNTQNSEKRAKNIALEMKYIAKVMYKNFGQTTLACTGGFDSRMTLASYLASGIKPKIAYGYGDSQLAQSKLGDVEINKEYSRRYGLDFYLAPWNETRPIDKNWNKYLGKYGYLIYDGCEDAHKFHTKEDEYFFSFGYGGEFFREGNWSKDFASKVTLDDYLWKCHADINANLIKNDSPIAKQWIQKWTKLNKEHNIEDYLLKKEDLFWINLDYRHTADNIMLNIVNQFKYAHYLMTDLRILRNGYLAFDEKYNGRFMIKILNKVYPDILNVSFFTHCKKMKYNPQLMQLEDYMTSSIMHKIKTFIRFILPSPVKRFINKNFRNNIEGSEYLDEIKSILKKDGNEEKLRRLIGDEVFNNLDLRINHILVLRGIILCKIFDSIEIEY